MTRTDAIFGDAAKYDNRVGKGAEALCRQLELENEAHAFRSQQAIAAMRRILTKLNENRPKAEKILGAVVIAESFLKQCPPSRAS